MLEIAGAPLRPKQHVDGRSYAKALRGDSYQRDGMFWYKWQARPDATGDTRAMSYIEGNYKIVRWIDEELVELFDLSKDIGEQTNLATDLPDRTQEMLATLQGIEHSVGDLREKGRKELERRLSKASDHARSGKKPKN